MVTNGDQSIWLKWLMVSGSDSVMFIVIDHDDQRTTMNHYHEWFSCTYNFGTDVVRLVVKTVISTVIES